MLLAVAMMQWKADTGSRKSAHTLANDAEVEPEGARWGPMAALRKAYLEPARLLLQRGVGSAPLGCHRDTIYIQNLTQDHEEARR